MNLSSNPSIKHVDEILEEFCFFFSLLFNFEKLFLNSIGSQKIIPNLQHFQNPRNGLVTAFIITINNQTNKQRNHKKKVQETHFLKTHLIFNFTYIFSLQTSKTNRETEITISNEDGFAKRINLSRKNRSVFSMEF
jgi:hypothetical protein